MLRDSTVHCWLRYECNKTRGRRFAEALGWKDRSFSIFLFPIQLSSFAVYVSSLSRTIFTSHHSVEMASWTCHVIWNAHWHWQPWRQCGTSTQSLSCQFCQLDCSVLSSAPSSLVGRRGRALHVSCSKINATQPTVWTILATVYVVTEKLWNICKLENIKQRVTLTVKKWHHHHHLFAKNTYNTTCKKNK